MGMTPKSGLLLALSCITGVAATGCVFELAYGNPDLGVPVTSTILAAAIPLTVAFLWFAIQDTRANYK
jgi:hypothetical protein